MKRLFIFLALACVACTAEIEPVKEDDSAVDLTCLISDESKAALSGSTPVWESGDKLMVISSDGQKSEFTLTSGAGSNEGVFSGRLGGTAPYSAVYPYSVESSVASGAVSLALQQEQSYRQDSFGSGSAVMATRFNEKGATVRFHNVSGFLRFKFKGNASIGRLVLTSLDADEKLGGTFNLSLDGGEGSSSQTMSPVSGGNSVTLNCGGVALNASAETDFWFSLPPGTLSSGFELKVYDNSSNLVTTLTSSKNHTIARSAVKTMACVEVNAGGVKNLSVDGNANCYIIPAAAGSYKFKAVKGNGNTSAGSVASVAVLWETVNTSTKPSVGTIVSSCSYSNNYITFSTTGNTKGNAVIAAKDSGGNVLWSWHIWKVDTPADLDFGDGRVLMDRNLGAISASAGNNLSAGLFYQWGRKDPFMGVSALNSGSSLMKATYSSNPITVGSNTNYGSYSIKNPMVFILEGSLHDWYTNTKANQNNSLWATSKTIYDPCPVGYQVPDGNFWYDLMLGGSGDKEAVGLSTLQSAGFQTNPASATNSTIKGLVFTKGGVSAWFPFTGICLGGPAAATSTPNGAGVWTCSTGGINSGVTDTSTLAKCMDLNCSPSSSSTWRVHTTWGSGRATGSAVRCVKMSTSTGDGSTETFERNDLTW